MKASAALLFLACFACAPVVTHGPRVEPGFAAGATLGLVPAALCDSCGAMLPTWGAYGRYGFVPDAAGQPAVLVTGTLGLGFVEGDLYVQAPGTGSLAYGAGVLGSNWYVMPYLQLGRSTRGSGFYTTQGFAWHRYQPVTILVPPHGDIAPRYWAPAVAYRARFREGALHVYVSGMVGEYGQREGGDSVRTTRHRLRAVAAGVTVERPASALPPFRLPPRLPPPLPEGG